MCRLQQEHHSFAHQSLTPTKSAAMSKTAAADQKACPAKLANCSKTRYILDLLTKLSRV